MAKQRREMWNGTLGLGDWLGDHGLCILMYPDGRRTIERVCGNTHTDLASEEGGESEEG